MRTLALVACAAVAMLIDPGDPLKFPLLKHVVWMSAILAIVVSFARKCRR